MYNRGNPGPRGGHGAQGGRAMALWCKGGRAAWPGEMKRRNRGWGGPSTGAQCRYVHKPPAKRSRRADSHSPHNLATHAPRWMPLPATPRGSGQGGGTGHLSTPTPPHHAAQAAPYAGWRLRWTSHGLGRPGKAREGLPGARGGTHQAGWVVCAKTLTPGASRAKRPRAGLPAREGSGWGAGGARVRRWGQRGSCRPVQEGIGHRQGAGHTQDTQDTRATYLEEPLLDGVFARWVGGHDWVWRGLRSLGTGLYGSQYG